MTAVVLWPVIAAISLLTTAAPVRADWPTLRGNLQRTGFVQAKLKPPFRLVWACHFQGERLGTAMEPIVAGQRVFVATHSGSLYALDAASGHPRWRFQARGPFLHSPAVAGESVIAGSTDGRLYAVDAKTGRLRWSRPVGYGGFAASPAVADGVVFIGDRAREFLAVELRSGRLRWRRDLGAPVRQTAAFGDGRVFVTAEDLRARCLDAPTGKVLWTSPSLAGQTARDYYPVLAKAGGRAFVMVRTNPVVNMAQRIAADRRLLCQTAGVDDRDWRKLDAWARSETARGTPEQWEKEQGAVARHLREHPEARTFFALDAATGEEAAPAPVLWCAGCQGVGTPPVALPDGRQLLFYRSAYGNWSHGVAPLVALGLLDLSQNRIELLQHVHGMRPPWNTFWGTADESQNFVVAGDLVLIVHQGTLSGFDLETKQLFLIGGNRDTFGGFRHPPWARNEWHGPARGGVAVVGNRLYWQTGSHILCLASGEQVPPAADVVVEGGAVPTHTAPKIALPDRARFRQRLDSGVSELLSQRWAPLYVEPGLAGREFFFDDSGELFEALAWAYPHLPADRQNRVRAWLADQWSRYPPFTTAGWYPLNEGQRRERFSVPAELLSRAGADRLPHPFGSLHAVWLYAERCGEWERVREAWPRLKASFEEFARMGWRLDGARGDLFANRYLSSLIALARVAEREGDTGTAARARSMSEDTAEALVAWWRRSAERAALPSFQGVAELDQFIGRGDALFFRVVPHRSKLALFHDLTPAVAARVKAAAPDAVTTVWRAFETLCPTWHLMGEERQVHSGENFVDPPDFALAAFKAMVWLADAPPEERSRRLDLPFCRADAGHLVKLALALEK